MGVKTLVSPEEYLSTHYEWEPEFVNGELRDRPMPTRTHGELVVRLSELLMAALRSRGFSVATDVRCKMTNGNYRIPDIAVFSPDAPFEDVPTVPPLVAVEILSNDDKHNELLDRLRDFEFWRVPNIWVVNPRFETLEVFESGSLKRVDALTLPEHGMEIRYSDLISIS